MCSCSPSAAPRCASCASNRPALRLGALGAVELGARDLDRDCELHQLGLQPPRVALGRALLLARLLDRVSELRHLDHAVVLVERRDQALQGALLLLELHDQRQLRAGLDVALGQVRLGLGDAAAQPVVLDGQAVRLDLDMLQLARRPARRLLLLQALAPALPRRPRAVRLVRDGDGGGCCAQVAARRGSPLAPPARPALALRAGAASVLLLALARRGQVTAAAQQRVEALGLPLGRPPPRPRSPARQVALQKMNWHRSAAAAAG
jgi:hypothetical protein